MDAAPKRLTFIARPWVLFAIAAALLLLLHIVIFRDVLAASGDIATGDASIVRDELVPFFSFTNGYMPAATSELTGSDEFRVTYSFWTSWVRYNPILPFMLLLVNTVAAFILFYAFYRITRHFTSSIIKAVSVSLIAAVLIHLVLLYAKIAHFYTLILGFSMFALATSMVIEQLFFAAKTKALNILSVSLLVLLNPAIHYHVLFYVAAGGALLLYALISWLTRTFNVGKLLRHCLYLGIIFAASLLPYLLFIWITTPASDDVFAQIPVNYWMIFYSSVPILHLLSFDSLGHVDLYRYGDYMAPYATISMLAIFGLFAGIFLLKDWRQLSVARKNLVFVLFTATLLAAWMAIGYSTPHLISFHDMLGAIMAAVTSTDAFFARIFEQLAAIFIGVLRFPHRFQFIFYLTAGLLLSISLLWLVNFIQKKWRLKLFVTLPLIALLVAIPFMASNAYRATFLTGNFDGFLAPYYIPQDLKDIKANLESSTTPNRLFILPSIESGRVITTQNQRHSFLDKYLIYFLEQPTVYTGYGANPANKIVAHMVYRSILDGTDLWERILIHNFGVTHLLIPHHTEARSEQTLYLPGLEDHIQTSLASSNSFLPVHTGTDFTLYQATPPDTQTSNTLVHLPWDALTQNQSSTATSTQHHLPVQMSQYQNASEKLLYTDSPERSFYSLYAAHTNTRALPNTSLLPYTPDLIASSHFTANMFSLSTLYDKHDTYNHTRQKVPSLLNLATAQFVGIIPFSANTATLQLNSKTSGDHRLALHAASKNNQLTVTLNGQTLQLNRIDNDKQTQKHLDFSYYIADVTLNEGPNQLVIPSNNETLLIEYATHLPLKDLPSDFSRSSSAGITLEPTQNQYIYTVRLLP